ncbi:MAG: hypothetical protein AAFR55_02705, partial [Pseudomonadota bacterium]
SVYRDFTNVADFEAVLGEIASDLRAGDASDIAHGDGDVGDSNAGATDGDDTATGADAKESGRDADHAVTQVPNGSAGPRVVDHGATVAVGRSR